MSEAATIPNRRSTTATRRLVIALYAAVSILLIVGTGLFIDQSRVREAMRQDTEISALAMALSERALRGLSTTDLALLDMAEALRYPAPTLPALLDGMAGRWLPRLPSVTIINAVDAHGAPLVVATQPGQPRTVVLPPLTNAGPSVGRLDGDMSPLRIGTPIHLGGQVGGDWFIPVERSLHQGGRWAGAVRALVSLRAFNNVVQKAPIGAHDTVSLLRTDGRLLAHFPAQDEMLGASLGDLPLETDVPADKASIHKGPWGSQKIESITAFRRVGDYPLIVAVSRPQAAALAPSTSARIELIGACAVLLALMLTVGIASLRNAQRRDAALAELGRMNAELEASVARRTSELEQSNRDLIAFSYSISHDLRAPLRAINGFAHAVREDYSDRLDAQGCSFIDRIYRASVRMGELIDALLSLTDISRQPLEMKSVDISAMAEEILDDLKLSERNRAVMVEIQPGMRTEGDEALLRNALSNLLHNAWKFTRARQPAVIMVSSEEVADSIRYTVADNGVGFDVAHAKRLFQPFQQLHSTQGFGGTGIGLASVRRIIERHGGRIWADAMPDEGSRFIFELPQRAAVVRRRRSNWPATPAPDATTSDQT
ncbi:MAG: ATP-binding protein [Rhodocyclaceae bacterium]